MTYVFDTTDPWGRTVRMSQSQFDHVVVDRNRTQFIGHIEVVKQTIEQPNVVSYSSTVANSEVYFRLGAHPDHPNLYVKVPVYFHSESEGTAATAILTDDLAGGTDSTRGFRRVYRRNS